MKTTEKHHPHGNSWPTRVNPAWLLLAGVILMVAAHLSYSIDLLGWVAMVPFLIYLQLTSGWKSRAWFTIALLAAWSLIVFKIITEPIPLFIVFMYSIPIGLFHLPGYLIWSRYKAKKLAILLFPALMVVLEWLQYTFTPLASWGAAAYTQAESLSIIQLTSIFGMAGMSFLVYWVNISLAAILTGSKPSYLNCYIPLTAIFIAIIFGSLRTDIFNGRGADVVTMAAVGTDSTIGGLPLPEDKKNETDIRRIMGRTERAAAMGSEVVVWNEGAFLLYIENEKEWVSSFQHLASTSNVTIVASYILLVSEAPLRYENKLVMINSNGEILYTYHKHQPVPGEPAVKGTETIESFTINGFNLGGAICYDYDFPYLAKENGRAKANIVGLPSSDWRGIDPLHTLMSRFRAIEQGHSILRSTRFGLSAAINPVGEITASMSSFDTNDKIMIATLPVRGLTTIYSIIGDAFVYVCLAFIATFTLKEYWLKRSP